MSIFALVLLPAVFVFLLAGSDFTLVCVEKSVVALAALFGAVVAIVFCTVDFFLLSAARFAVYDFAAEFAALFVQELALPFALVFALLLLLYRDSFAFKLRAFSFALLGFYAVFMPYRIITRFKVLSPFMIALKPLLVLALLSSLYFALGGAGQILESGKKALSLPLFFAALLVLPLPAAVETAWFLNSGLIVWATCAVIFALFAFVALPILSTALCRAAQK